jgi:hypothetical protein
MTLEELVDKYLNKSKQPPAPESQVPEVGMSEDFLKALQVTNPPPSLGLLGATKEAVVNPWESTKSIAGVIPTVGKAIGQQGMNLINSILPGVKMPGSSDAALPTPKDFSPGEILQNVGLRANRASNALLLGLPDVVLKALFNNISRRLPAGAENAIEGKVGTKLNFEDKTLAAVLGMGETALMDTILPLRQTTHFLQGKDAEGNPLTPETYGRDAAMLMMSWLPVKGMLSSRLKVAQKVIHPEVSSEIFKTFRTAGEVEAAAEKLKNIKSLTAQKGWLGKQVVETKKAILEGEETIDVKPKVPTLPELEDHFQMLHNGALNDDRLAPLLYAVTRSEAYLSTWAKLKGAGFKENKALAEAVRRGALPDDTLRMVMEERGIPMETAISDVSNALANVIEKTSSIHGKGLSTYSRTMRQALEEEILKAKKSSDPAAIRQLIRFRKMVKNMTRDPNANILEQAETVSRTANVSMEFLRNAEKLWLSTILSQPATAARNVISQTGIAGLQLFGHVASGFVKTAGNKMAGNGWQFARSFTDLTQDFIATATALSPTGARSKLFEKVLDSMPGLGESIRTGSQMAVSSRAWSDIMRAGALGAKRAGTFGEGIGGRTATRLGEMWKTARVAGAFDTATDILTGANRLQETFIRKFFFDSQLSSNLKALGYEGEYAKLLTDLNAKTGIDDQLRGAITDAYIHSMKQTLAHTPEGAVPRAFLSAMNKIPLLPKVLIMPFPRFLTNQMMFLYDREPFGWTKLFSPEIREALTNANKDGLASVQASRAFGKAAEGNFLMSAAWTMKQLWQPEGFKYYELDTGEKGTGGHSLVLDARNYQPFVPYLALAHMIDAVQKGKNLKDLPYTTNEWADMLLSIRRLSEMGMFALPDIMDAAFKGDIEALHKDFGTVAGQFAASFFLPFKTLKDVSSAWDEDAANQPDIEGQELTGPLRANIPTMLLSESAELPTRVDYTTGNPMKSDRPWVRQMSGMTLREKTPLRGLIESTPGITERGFVGSYDTPEANRLVAESMGSLFGMELNPDSGETIGDLVTNVVKDMNLTPPMQKYLIQTIVAPMFRNLGVSLAKQLKPDLFIPNEILQGLPSYAKEPAQDMIQQILGQLRAKGVIDQP